MTSLEKQLLRRVEVLERRYAEMMQRLGMDSAAMDKYEMDEALRYMAERGDPALIKDYLQKVNGRKPCSANT